MAETAFLWPNRPMTAVSATEKSIDRRLTAMIGKENRIIPGRIFPSSGCTFTDFIVTLLLIGQG